MENKENIINSTQEQAVGSWINYLNDLRIQELTNNIAKQNNNLNNAIKTLKSTTETINKEIINTNRGGSCGMHGFIAEIAECGVSNAKDQIVGKGNSCIWVNDNGPTDLIVNNIDVQQKFCNANFSLNAVQEHLKKYPDYIKNGGKYMIPKNHYETIKRLMELSEKEANKTLSNTGENTINEWKRVHNVMNNNNIKLKDLEPSKFEYSDVQRGKIHKSLKREENDIRQEDVKMRENYIEQSKPTFKQASNVALISATLESGTSFISSILSIKSTGKRLSQFSEDDWKYIIKETGKSALKGEIRGYTVYGLTNYCKTPAAVANAFCTATFGIAEQVYLLKQNKIDEEQFWENSESLCLDVTVSALSSTIGQAIIPIPVLGAIIGNTVGTIILENVKNVLSKKEYERLLKYVEELDNLKIKLEEEYQKEVTELQIELNNYLNMLMKAFNPNYELALEGSVELAIASGIKEEKILKNVDDINRYFMS
jgi:hypothetical protein